MTSTEGARRCAGEQRLHQMKSAWRLRHDPAWRCCAVLRHELRSAWVLAASSVPCSPSALRLPALPVALFRIFFSSSIHQAPPLHLRCRSGMRGLDHALRRLCATTLRRDPQRAFLHALPTTCPAASTACPTGSGPGRSPRCSIAASGRPSMAFRIVFFLPFIIPAVAGGRDLALGLRGLRRIAAATAT